LIIDYKETIPMIENNSSINLSEYKFLITGGAGFIGSNLVEYLLKSGAFVRVLDNLSNGYYENIAKFRSSKNFEFIEGDIRNIQTCRIAAEDMDFISHQAALGSVPRSIKDPILSNEVNVSGFLNMLVAAKESPSIKRMVYAASSSSYGDSTVLPKIEGNEGRPVSPYAVTKLTNEYYADIFSKVYNFHTIGLRYFNVFGPNQNPNNPYAAVIPIFCNSFINGNKILVNGDGETSRDFTYVDNVVQANLKALTFDLFPNKFSTINQLNSHEVVNVACGERTTLNEIISKLTIISGKSIQVEYGKEREGDVRHSQADITKIRNLLGYEPKILFQAGLEKVYNWYLSKSPHN